MDIKVFPEYQQMSEAIANVIADTVRKKPDAILCSAAGHTPVGTFRHMINMSQRGEVSFERCTFVSLDEWGGITKGVEGSCKDFMYKYLFDPLKIKEENCIFFNGCGILEKECKMMNTYLEQNGPIDFMLLGIGMNGHLGFNEPGTSFDTYAHVAPLDKITIKVGKKYFLEEMQFSVGITLGMKHMKQANKLVLAANGTKKADIIKKLVESEPNDMLPATLAKTRENSFLYLDKEAASKI